MVSVETERRFGHEPEFIVDCRVGRDRHVDPDFVRFAVLGPDLVELDHWFVKLDQLVDEVRFHLSFLGQFVVTLVFDLGLAVETFLQQPLFCRLGLHREVDSGPRLECECLRIDFESEERILHFEAFTL